MAYLQLSKVIYRLPRTEAGVRFYAALAGFLKTDVNSASNPGEVAVNPLHPPRAQPSTQFELADVTVPTVWFETDAPIHLDAGGLRLMNHSSPNARVADMMEPNVQHAHDHVPSDLQLEMFSGLLERVGEHLLRVDHTGILLPEATVNAVEWQALIGTLSGVTCMFTSPNELRAFFILPCTGVELEGGIRQFPPGRDPKLELARADIPQPIIHIQMDTDLSATDLEQRLQGLNMEYRPGTPDLISIHLPGGWDGLNIRLDLAYEREAGSSDWATGEWLHQHGFRYTA